MTNQDADRDKVKPVEHEEAPPMPEVNALGFDDLNDCLRKGFSDFLRAPLFGLFFGGVFACGGLVIILSLFVWDQVWMVYPVVIGFPLIGPFVAVGLYDVSRRLESGQPLVFNEILSVVWQQSGRELRWMAFLLFLFI